MAFFRPCLGLGRSLHLTQRKWVHSTFQMSAKQRFTFKAKRNFRETQNKTIALMQRSRREKKKEKEMSPAVQIRSLGFPPSPIGQANGGGGSARGALCSPEPVLTRPCVSCAAQAALGTASKWP